jgi:four helix bundle protein
LNETTEQFRQRTKTLAVRVVRLFRSLPDSRDAQVIGTQLLRCGTAVGANYRAVCRARSKADFISKIGIVLEEADETVFWLELLGETGIMTEHRMKELLQEARELTAIFTATQRTSRSH